MYLQVRRDNMINSLSFHSLLPCLTDSVLVIYAVKTVICICFTKNSLYFVVDIAKMSFHFSLEML